MRSRFLHRLFLGIADFFAGSEKPPKTTASKKAGAGDSAAAAAPESAPPRSRRIDTSDPEAMSRRLTEFREKNKRAVEALITGSVTLLGFSEIKRRFGDRWEEIKPKAAQIIEDCIERRLTKEDIYVAISEEHYVILYGEASKSEAENRSKMIANDISRRLCGNFPGGAKVSVSSIVVKLDKSVGLDGITNISALQEALATAQVKEEKEETDGFRQTLAELSFVYWPSINTRKRLVSSYFCTLVRRTDKMVLTDTEAYPSGGSGLLTCEVDCMALEAAGKALKDLNSFHHKATLVVPVSFETLSTRRFVQKYIEIFKKMPALSKKRLILQIFDLPVGLPQARLRVVLTAVYPFSLGFMVRFPLAHRSFANLAAAGIVGIVTDASLLALSDKSFDAMQLTAKACRKAQFRPVLQGVRSTDLATAAVKAGYEYINGVAVFPQLPKPGRVYRFTAEQLRSTIGEPTKAG